MYVILFISSHEALVGPGNFAVDGITNSIGKLYHSKLSGSDPFPWFQIDLMREYVLFKIVIYGRVHNMYRMTNIKVLEVLY